METILSYGYLSILIGAFIDVFFLSGYIFYGALLFTTAVALYLAGLITAFEIFLAAFLGTSLGSITNFYVGRFFGNLKSVQKITHSKTIATTKRNLDTYGLFLFIVIGRSITLLRPAYGVFLGTLKINTKKFLFYECIIAFLWTSFWVMVLATGSDSLEHLFNYFASST